MSKSSFGSTQDQTLTQRIRQWHHSGQVPENIIWSCVFLGIVQVPTLHDVGMSVRRLAEGLAATASPANDSQPVDCRSHMASVEKRADCRHRADSAGWCIPVQTSAHSVARHYIGSCQALKMATKDKDTSPAPFSPAPACMSPHRDLALMTGGWRPVWPFGRGYIIVLLESLLL